MNANSSRSHGIVYVYRKNQHSSSSFSMVDLAGSEGVRRTGHIGEAQVEGSYICKGLLGISNIYKALSDGSCLVPYRDTVLGSVLKGNFGNFYSNHSVYKSPFIAESLNLDSFSTLVICISALKQDVSETIHSLGFALKVKNKKNKPKIVPTFQPERKVSVFLY